MIVVDANILAYYFIQGAKSPEAARLHAADSEWVVPALWRHEFLNILATAGKAAPGSRAVLPEIWKAVSTRLLERERPVDYSRALSLSIDFKVSAYDAQYLTLAASLDLPCITEDKKLIKASRGIAVSMADFLASRA